MGNVREWLLDWGSLIALCAFAGFLSCVNHLPAQQMTARQFAVNMIGSVFLGITAVLWLDGASWTDKQKLSAALVVGYVATPVLHGLYRLASGFRDNPEKWINRK